MANLVTININRINIKGINDRAREDKIKKKIVECLTTNLTGDELSNVSVNINTNIKNQ